MIEKYELTLYFYITRRLFINYYDTRLSKYPFFGEHNYVNIYVTMDNRYIYDYKSYTIENFNMLSHGINDFDNKVKEAFCIKKQKHLLNKHLH